MRASGLTLGSVWPLPRPPRRILAFTASSGNGNETSCALAGRGIPNTVLAGRRKDTYFFVGSGCSPLVSPESLIRSCQFFGVIASLLLFSNCTYAPRQRLTG